MTEYDWAIILVGAFWMGVVGMLLYYITKLHRSVADIMLDVTSAMRQLNEGLEIVNEMLGNSLRELKTKE